MKETRGTTLVFGAYGLQALEAGWVSAKQLEAARRAMTRFIQRGGKIWIRVFPDKPVTQRPPEVTMGGGKGDVAYYVVPVKPGRILFEMDGVPRTIAEEALRLASYKLSVRTRVIAKP
jgi:large subunit ribosomal protein L16